MSDCVFCKIVSGQIPCYQVYEDQNFLAFLDINPISRGHIQLVPKQHYRWVFDIPNFGEYFETVKKVSLAVKAAVNADYVSLLTFGREVEHAHVWIVPRFWGDPHEGKGVDTTTRLKFSLEELTDIQSRIIQSLHS